MTSLNRYDGWMLLATAGLLGLGALMVYSSTSVLTPAMAEQGASEYFYFIKHLVTMALGFVAMYVAYGMEQEKLRKLALPLLALSFILLVMVFLPGIGITAGGARRWLRLWPSTFQPSEFVKLSMVVFLAWYMSLGGYKPDRFEYFVVPVIVMLMFQGVFLKQPDFGAAMNLGMLTLCMLFISGVRLRYLMYVGLLGAPAVWYLIREPYRWKRLTSFIDPWKYQHEGGFQLVQSFLALGSGGLTGVGLGQSMQKLDYLPEVHTDFIFSVVGEELGFLRALVVVGAFALIFYRGVTIAERQRGGFGYYLAYGLSLMIALQALLNIFVVTGMLPTKGLPLPFISYGGSALLINMAAVGLLLNISRTRGEARPVTSRAVRESAIEDLMKKKRAKVSVYGKRK